MNFVNRINKAGYYNSGLTAGAVALDARLKCIDAEIKSSKTQIIFVISVFVNTYKIRIYIVYIHRYIDIYIYL